MELLLDRAKRYRRLALLFAEEETAKIRVNKQVGAARRQGEETVNHIAKSEAAD